MLDSNDQDVAEVVVICIVLVFYVVQQISDRRRGNKETDPRNWIENKLAREIRKDVFETCL